MLSGNYANNIYKKKCKIPSDFFAIDADFFIIHAFHAISWRTGLSPRFPGRVTRSSFSIHSVPYAQLALSPSALVPDCIGPTGKASSGLSLNQVGSRAGVGLQETRHWVPGQSVIDARVAGPTSR